MWRSEDAQQDIRESAAESMFGSMCARIAFGWRYMCMRTNAKATDDQALSQTFAASAASSSIFGPRRMSVQQQQIRECEAAAKLMDVTLSS